MSLPSEAIWSLIIASLMGLWLIRQSIIISYQIDILIRLAEWCKKRSIVLPSFGLILTPFLVPYLINHPSESSNEFVKTPLTILATASSIFIGNRYIEGFRKRQEQKKIAKLIVSSIQGQIEQLKAILTRLKGTLSKTDAESIEIEVEQIQNDFIYESALSQIGVFELKEVDTIAEYSRNLSSILRNILKSYNKEEGYTNIHFQAFTKKKAEAFLIEAKLLAMTLSNKVIQDDSKFYQCKEEVKNDYCSRRFRTEKLNSEIYNQMIKDDLLQKIESLFDEFALIAELENFYKSRKIELEEYLESSQDGL